MKHVAMLTVALAVPCLSLACPSRKSDAPPATSASVASGSASGSAALASSSSGAPVVASGSSSASSSSAAPFATVGFRDLVAVEAWALAAQALDSTAAKEPDSFVRLLARTRAAVGLCTKPEGERALAAFAKLREDKLAAPLESVLARLEVDAMVCAERYDDALKGPHGLPSRSGAIAARTLARVLEATGDLDGARAALTKAIDGGPQAGLPVGALLVWRLRLDRKKSDDRAIDADRKRLFLEFPSSFDEAVAAGEPRDEPKLSLDEWWKRAKSLAVAGRSDDALAAIDQAAKAFGPAVSPRRVAREKGSALYRAKAYARAAVALDDAAKLGGAPNKMDDDALDDAFHAARSLSRAGDDPAAIARYDALHKAQPSSHWGAEAGFLAGNLRFLRGDFAGAIAAFDRYVAKSSKVDKQETNLREAKRARAIAMLESGQAGAAKAFDTLAASKDYDQDSYAWARLQLLRAVSLERAGDKAQAITLLQKLRGMHPYGFVDLAARRRLSALGDVSSPPFPSGPIPPSGAALPAPIDLLSFSGLVRDARSLLGKPAGDDESRCAAFNTIEAGYDAYVIGQKLMVSKPLETSPWVWTCAYPRPYDAVVAALEAREGLPRGLMHAILRQESGFRVEVVSPAGAVGIAQLMPFTAAATASQAGTTLDQTDIAALQAPFLQLDLSARHLHSLFSELGAPVGPGADADQVSRVVPLVFAAYNAGAGAVKRWLGEAGTMDADVFVERIPFIETRGYTARVLGNMVRYAIFAGTAPPTLPAKFQ